MRLHARHLSCAAVSSPSTVARVVLKGGRSKLFTQGQQAIVYSGSVDKVVGRPAPGAGDTVFVCNGAMEPLAWGLYNPLSQYRVRIMERLDTVQDADLNVEKIVTQRLLTARQLRTTLGLPSSSTNAYRLVNSEGDGLSGLIIDVLSSCAVASCSAAWVEKHRSLIEAKILSSVKEVDTVIWRQAPELNAEEGWPLRDEHGQQEDEQVIVLERGLKFACSPRSGQKTGFYADQRDHREFIGRIAGNKDVLDVCCYSGGFSLSAAAGGAQSVVGVDSSQPAIDLALCNAKMNGLDRICSFTKADAGQFLKQAHVDNKLWDIVVLDPPKLAPSRKHLARALRKYQSLNTAAMRLVRPGGLLMTCSCSGAVAQSQEFLPMLSQAAQAAKRKITVIRRGGAAPDHPVDPGYQEGTYLTNVTLRVDL